MVTLDDDRNCTVLTPDTVSIQSAPLLVIFGTHGHVTRTRQIALVEDRFTESNEIYPAGSIIQYAYSIVPGPKTHQI